MRAKTKELTDKLESGIQELKDSEKYKKWLCTMAKFHGYSFANCILIQLQFPNATRIAGYRTWQSLKRQVKKGEKAISIFAPLVKRTKGKDADGEDKDEKEVFGFMPVSVFDVSQTEGDELPEIYSVAKEDISSSYPKLYDALVSISPVPITFGKTFSPTMEGYYSHGDNRIVIKEGLPQAQTIKTMVHEIAHAMIHSDGETLPHAREIEAESIAYCVCQWLGIDTGCYSFPYVLSWSTDKELKDVKDSLTVIQRTSSSIIDSLEDILKKEVAA